MENIGSVIVNQTYYYGNDMYSDGIIEDEFLSIAKHGNFENTLRHDNRWPILYHFSDIRENLLEWYPFSEDSELLEIGAGCGAMTGLFCRRVKKVTAIELSMKRSMVNANRNHQHDNLEIIVGNFEEIEPNLQLYDYITLIGVWEYSVAYISGENPYKRMLSLAQKHLKPNGKIFIAIENKMGIKYWNGACEDHTGKQFSGLQNYVDCNHARTFSKPEIENIFANLGMGTYTFYYPMPDYKLPEVIYTDDILPQPGTERNFRKDYSESRQYLFNDAIVMDQICSDKMFPYFANSFLIIIGDDSPKISFCKYNRQRRREYRTKIEIYEDIDGKKVRKSPLTKEAEQHIQALKEKERFCLESELPMICPKGDFVEKKYYTEYVNGKDLNIEFYKAQDMQPVIHEFQNMRRIFMNSALNNHFYLTDEYTEWFGDASPKESCSSMKWTNIDMSLSNIRRDDKKRLVCIDYEWVYKFPIPVDYVVWRMMNEFFYSYGAYLKNKMSIQDICISIGIPFQNLDVFEKMESEFASRVFGDKCSELYLQNYVKPCVSQSVVVRI